MLSNLRQPTDSFKTCSLDFVSVNGLHFLHLETRATIRGASLHKDIKYYLIAILDNRDRALHNTQINLQCFVNTHIEK
jgi:hypothetical protein